MFRSVPTNITFSLPPPHNSFSAQNTPGSASDKVAALRAALDEGFRKGFSRDLLDAFYAGIAGCGPRRRAAAISELIQIATVHFAVNSPKATSADELQFRSISKYLDADEKKDMRDFIRGRHRYNPGPESKKWLDTFSALLADSPEDESAESAFASACFSSPEMLRERNLVNNVRASHPFSEHELLRFVSDIDCKPDKMAVLAAFIERSILHCGPHSPQPKQSYLERCRSIFNDFSDADKRSICVEILRRYEDPSRTGGGFWARTFLQALLDRPTQDVICLQIPQVMEKLQETYPSWQLPQCRPISAKFGSKEKTVKAEIAVTQPEAKPNIDRPTPSIKAGISSSKSPLQSLYEELDFAAKAGKIPEDLLNRFYTAKHSSNNRKMRAIRKILEIINLRVKSLPQPTEADVFKLRSLFAGLNRTEQESIKKEFLAVYSGTQTQETMPWCAAASQMFGDFHPLALNTDTIGNVARIPGHMLSEPAPSFPGRVASWFRNLRPRALCQSADEGQKKREAHFEKILENSLAAENFSVEVLNEFYRSIPLCGKDKRRQLISDFMKLVIQKGNRNSPLPTKQDVTALRSIVRKLPSKDREMIWNDIDHLWNCASKKETIRWLNVFCQTTTNAPVKDPSDWLEDPQKKAPSLKSAAARDRKKPGSPSQAASRHRPR